MKNILLIIALIFLIIPWLQVNAFEVKVGEEVYLTGKIDGDLYVAGGSVDASVPINGDLFVAGGDININSDIKQDLIITGGQITVSGNVGDDVRIAGGNVKIGSNINGDLLVGAGTVRIDKGVVIGGDLVVGGGRVIVDGEVKGNAKIAAGQLVLNGIIDGDADLALEEFLNTTKTGVIKGNLKYRSTAKIQDLENSSKSKIVFEKSIIKEKVKKDFIGFITTYLIIKVIGLFLFSTLIYFYLNKYFSMVSDNLRNSTGKSFLYGFLTIIGTPVIILLLFVSVIGVYFALLLLFAYIFMFVFLSLINVIVFTSFFVDKYSIKNIYKKILLIFGLTLFFGLINGINLIAGFFTLGAIAINKIEMLESLRSPNKDKQETLFS